MGREAPFSVPSFWLERLRRTWRAVPFVPQVTPADCGTACLAMILEFHGLPAPREEIRTLLGTGRDGTTARSLLLAAHRFGTSARALRVEPAGLRHLKLPAILHWNMNHFVVLESVSAAGGLVVDPGIGRRHVGAHALDEAFTGIALEFEPVPDAGRKGASPRNDVLGTLRSSAPWSRIFVLSFIVQVLGLALPATTGILVQHVVPRQDDGSLVVLGVMIVVLILHQSVAGFVRAHMLLALRVVFELRLTGGLARHLLRLPYAYFQARPAGDLHARLTSAAVIREMLTGAFMTALLDGTLLLLYLATLVLVSPVAACIVFFLIVVQLAIAAVGRRQIREREFTALERRVRHESYQYEMLSGIETVKALGAEALVEERWSDLFVENLQASHEQGRATLVVDALGQSLRVLAPVVVLLQGASAAIAGSVSLGSVLVASTVTSSIFMSLSSLVGATLQAERSRSHFERIRDIMEVAPERRARLPAAHWSGKIELENVSFRQSASGDMTIADVSLCIEPGEFVAIVGASGSGKSTLGRLLLGLCEPTTGVVRVDGFDLRQVDAQSFRASVGVVTQASSVFAGTIRSNIALRNPDASLDEVASAAQSAHVHSDIMSMPLRYETTLTNGGSNLSGGQRQRIALARALLGRPSILLLDEATSALDAVTESRVNETLASLGCTRIVIAHRLSTIAAADRVVVVEKGRIIESGRHDQLLRLEGTYSRLVSHQLRPGV